MVAALTGDEETPPLLAIAASGLLVRLVQLDVALAHIIDYDFAALVDFFEGGFLLHDVFVQLLE